MKNQNEIIKTLLILFVESGTVLLWLRRKLWRSKKMSSSVACMFIDKLTAAEITTNAQNIILLYMQEYFLIVPIKFQFIEHYRSY